MADLEQTILSRTPDNWDKTRIDPYRRINVSRNTSEFDSVFERLRRAHPKQELKQLERVQHLYSYGQFLVRTQFLLKSNPSVTYYKLRRYIVLNKRYLQEAITYNVDPRRCGKGKSVTFSSSFDYVQDDCVVLVVQIVTSTPNISFITPERSSDYYIEYVAYFED